MFLREYNVVFGFYAHPGQSAPSLTGLGVYDTKPNCSGKKGRNARMCMGSGSSVTSLERLVLEGCVQLPERFKS